MIENEKQYKVARKKLVQVDNKILSMLSVDSAIQKDQLIIASLLSLKKELEDEIKIFKQKP